MLTYHLQSDGKRQMIDSRRHTGWKRVQGAKCVKARSWIAAKKAFGFALTDLQDMILNG